MFPDLPPVPRVSVVIPVWNRRETLRMSVESVLRQTFTDFELIVVDDGSTDGTMEAIADLADPRIRRLAHETNKGVSAARNTGIRAARGEWVAFQDSDDEWLPLKLEKQMARLEGAESGVVACYTGLVHIERPAGRSGRTVLNYFPDPKITIIDSNFRRLLLTNPPAITPTLIVRGDILQKIGGFDERITALEDWECFFRLVQYGQFIFLDEPLVQRNMSENSISHDLHKMLEGREAVFKKHRAEILAEYPQALIRHHITYAGMRRRRGELSEARDALANAARLQPFSPSIRLRQLRLLGVALRERLRR